MLGHRHPDRRTFPDVWDVPGGRIEPGESAERAMVRELEEELGIHVEMGRLVPWRTVEFEAYSMTLFVIDRWTNDVAIADRTEHDRLGWFRLDELPTLRLATRRYEDLLSAAMAT